MATEFTAEYVTEAIGGGVKIEGGILRGAKMLGVRSKNKNRHYTPEAVKRSAHLYDGVPCNIDHAKDLAAGSSVLKRFGMWRNPRVVDGALIGDLHFNPEHVYAKQFIWAVENQPTTIGFSHVAKLNEKRVGKEMVVEGIEKVKSVDWVADPATTGGVFEDEEPENAPEEIPLTGRARGLSSLSDDQFAYVEPGGSRDGGGRTTPRSKRLFPLNNADAVRVALNAIPKLTRLPEEERTKALARAKSAAARFKITPFAKAASTSEGVMDLTGLTMEDFRAMRPDLVESLTKEAAVGDAVEKLTKENTELKKKLGEFEAEAERQKRSAELDEMLEEAGIDPANPKHVKKSFRRVLEACTDPKELAELIQERYEELEEAGLLEEAAESVREEPVRESRSFRREQTPKSRFASAPAVGAFDHKDSKSLLGSLRSRR